MLLIIIKNAQGDVCAQVPYAGGALTIGRDKTRNIVLDSKAVSRHHGSLLSSGGKVLYIDEGSSNGSTVDGQPVTAPVPLSGRSVVQIGEFRMMLQIQQPAATSAPADVPSAAAATPTSPPEPVTQAPAAPVSPPVVSHEETLTIEPILRAKPVQERVPVVNGLEGFRITLDEHLQNRDKKPEAPRFSNKVDGLLEQQIQGIRSQRQDVQETQRQRREQFDQAWKEAIVAARQLKTRTGADPRVLFFVIARDEREVTVKLKENSARGFCNFSISLHHPVKETAAEGLAWFAETGDEPRSYGDPKEMMEDFVRAIAGKLA